MSGDVPSSGGISPHRGPMREDTERHFGPPTVLTPQARDDLRKEIVELMEAEPHLSKSEVARRLAPKYGVSGATVRKLTH